MMAAVASRVLKGSVLVLNRHWAPIQVTTVKEAISLVAKGSAKIIDPSDFSAVDLVTWNDVSRAKTKHGDSMIRSQRLALVPPEVIVLAKYDGQGEKSVVFSRKNIFKRDKYTCMFCGVQPGPEELTIDHVMPKSRGGKSTWENCVLACVECNKRKANRTPDEAGMKMRKQPKKPSWKTLAHVNPRERKESWDNFLSRVYWEIELDS
jgi:5-methylcytosine-specific restriction endonuclease McrA